MIQPEPAAVTAKDILRCVVVSLGAISVGLSLMWPTCAVLYMIFHIYALSTWGFWGWYNAQYFTAVIGCVVSIGLMKCLDLKPVMALWGLINAGSWIGGCFIIDMDSFWYQTASEGLRGLGIGGILTVVPLYLYEIAPANGKQAFLAVFGTGVGLGVFAGFLTLNMIADFSSFTTEQLKYPAYIGTGCGVMLMLFSLLPLTQSYRAETMDNSATWFDRRHARTIISLVLMQFGEAFSGFYILHAFISGVTQVTQAAGYNRYDQTIAASAWLAGSVIRFLLLKCTARHERVWTGSMCLSAAGLIARGLSIHFSWNHTVTIAMTCLTYAGYGLCSGDRLGVLYDSVPSNLRASMSAIQMLVTFLANCIVISLFCWAVDPIGVAGILYAMGSATFVVTVVSQLTMPPPVSESEYEYVDLTLDRDTVYR